METPCILTGTLIALCATATATPIKMPTIQDQCQQLYDYKVQHNDFPNGISAKEYAKSTEFTVTDQYSDFTITPQTVNCWDVKLKPRTSHSVTKESLMAHSLDNNYGQLKASK